MSLCPVEGCGDVVLPVAVGADTSEEEDLELRSGETEYPESTVI